jgi:nitrate/nitrite-specific signal transduction histidine kinase
MPSGKLCGTGQKGHYGLRIMQESMEEIGGEAQIEPLLYVGTRVTLFLPYEPILFELPMTVKRWTR